MEENQTQKHYPSPPADTPAIGELQPPSAVSTDLAQLRRIYGDGYGTSGYGLLNSAPQPVTSNALVLEAWFNNTKLPELKPQDLITEGIELIKEQYADFNSITHVFGFRGAEMAIHLGKILNKLKLVARKTGESWGSWAAKHLPFIKARTRERFMNLAKRRDCHKYAVLGTDRLDILCAATKDFSDEADPIGTFMAKHSITFDPSQEFVLEEFAEQIDIAINCERVEAKGFVIPSDKIATLHKLGREVDQPFLKSLTIAQQSGGSPEAVVERLILNGGKDDQESIPAKRLADFNTSAAKMVNTLDFIIANQDHVDLIDRETYQKLITKLAAIQNLRNMSPAEDEEAAQ